MCKEHFFIQKRQNLFAKISKAKISMVKISIDWEETTVSPRIVGLVCDLKPANLAWNIAQNGDFEIERLEDLRLSRAKSDHICFKITHLDTNENVFLVLNKGSDGWFYTKMKKIDYFLIERNKKSDFWKQIVHIFSLSKFVTFAIELELPKNNDKYNFLDIE